MKKCPFWANVMSKQPHVRAFRASPAQKKQGLRAVLFQKLFKGYILYLLFHSNGRCVFELCPWNKFEEKTQCAHSVKITHAIAQKHIKRRKLTIIVKIFSIDNNKNKCLGRSSFNSCLGHFWKVCENAAKLATKVF